VCENQPQEAIKTNIDGTINVINAAIKYKVKKVIDVSTDKAVSPCNTYGFTKALGERLTIQANNLTKDTDFVCIRGGNVLGSNGSVVPLFIDQIKKFNKITLTYGGMTRFFLTLSEAISLLFKATEFSVGGETYIMNMPAFRMSDVAKVLIKHYGNKDTKIEEIGIREGEKIHEVLVSEHESSRTYIFNNDYYVIMPELKISRDYSHIKNMNKVSFDIFSSTDNIKDEEYLTGMLGKGGFLV
jgi:FlaA1/EpsC-like NDP-sugar epimerase